MARHGKARDKHFSDSIKAMRVALCKSQTWLVSKLNMVDPNINQSHIYYYEANKMGPSKEVKAEIKKTFSNEIKAQTKTYGEWKKEFIAIRYLTEMVNLNRYDYENQRKYYNLLRKYIITHQNLHEWDFKVFDNAFGEMHPFKKEGES